MRIVFNLISILIVIAVIFFASLNTETVFNLAIWKVAGTKAILLHMTLVQVILITFIAGILAGIFWVSTFYVGPNAKLKEYQKKLEKTSIQSEEESSKVAVLEEKIKVLEKALDSALNKDNQ